MIFFSYALGGVNHTLSNVSGSGFDDKCFFSMTDDFLFIRFGWCKSYAK